MSNALHHALRLIGDGYMVFPMIAAEKRPACRHGVKDATNDPALVQRWFRRDGIVPAIATGEPSGISILDVDRQHGGGAWYAADRDRLPRTMAWRTRSGGLHIPMRHRPELRTCAIADGVEIRATGASAIYWPAAGFPLLCDAAPADWPDWLLPAPKAAWTPSPAVAWQGDDQRMRRYCEAALRQAVERVAAAAPGTRNAALNRETFSLMRLTNGGGLHPGEIAEAMAHAALAAGLDRIEIQKTITSAMAARGKQ